MIYESFFKEEEAEGGKVVGNWEKGGRGITCCVPLPPPSIQGREGGGKVAFSVCALGLFYVN